MHLQQVLNSQFSPPPVGGSAPLHVIAKFFNPLRGDMAVIGGTEDFLHLLDRRIDSVAEGGAKQSANTSIA